MLVQAMSVTLATIVLFLEGHGLCPPSLPTLVKYRGHQGAVRWQGQRTKAAWPKFHVHTGKTFYLQKKTHTGTLGG